MYKKLFKVFLKYLYFFIQGGFSISFWEVTKTLAKESLIVCRCFGDGSGQSRSIQGGPFQ